MNIVSDKAVVSPKAELGDNVIIKDFAVIEDKVAIGSNTTIEPFAVIKSNTTIGNNCKIYNGAVLGGDPQDLTFKDENTSLVIGDGTVVREYVTISRGTAKKGITILGNNCYIMAYSHVGHDCVLGNNVLIVNSVEIAGHVTIEDWVYVSSIVAIHQFVKIGKHSLVTFITKVAQDIPPFIIAGGNPLSYMGLNIVGLKRRGFETSRINSIKKAYDIIYDPKLNFGDAIKCVKDTLEMTDDINDIVNFIDNSQRGILRKR